MEGTPPYLIYIRTLTGRVWPQEVRAEQTISQLKAIIEDKQGVETSMYLFAVTVLTSGKAHSVCFSGPSNWRMTEPLRVMVLEKNQPCFWC
jgi:hypothetical protein